MSEYEYQEAINARAAMNRENEAKRAKMAEEAEQASRLVKHSRAIRKANKALIKRAVIAVMLCAVLLLAQFFNLIDWHLAVPIMCATMIWVAVWFGSWLQFRFCKGGLLEWN